MNKQLNNDQPYRLDSGGSIDRSQPLSFSFDGAHYSGYRGDTVASALLANGIKLLGRSFKYHRPRGIVTAGSDEPNALLELHNDDRREANTRATTTELYDGLIATSQNRWPSLKHDVMSVNGLLSPIFVAGFYYKTFMWPAKAWLFYEHFIRRAAGLGRAAQQADPDHYAKGHAFCDILIVGAGPSGMTAAIGAARGGYRVILVDENTDIGGSLRYQSNPETENWLWQQQEAIARLDNITVLKRTSAIGAYDHGTYGLLERVTDHVAPGSKPHLPRQRLWTVRTHRTIYATGAVERSLVFGNNDKPGVMLTSAIQAYANCYAVLPGKRIVLFTNNDSAYTAASELNELGAQVTVVDSRHETAMTAEAAARGISCYRNSQIIKVIGNREVKAVRVYDANESKKIKLKCDLVGMSGGWSPNLHLQCHKGGKPSYDEKLVAFVEQQVSPNERTIGSADGIWGFEQCIESAQLALKGSESKHLRSNSINCEPLWQVERYKGKAFVDFQNDVAVSDINLAQREGYRSVEHLKRYTTLGMATDQGKLSNINGLAILAQARQQDIHQVGTTTYRPPYVPIAIGALAGQSKAEHVAPKRLTPLHDWHITHSAKMLNVGAWLRPWYYPQTDTQKTEDVNEASIREADHVRAQVGIIDVTTLGKIAVQGPDAAEFLNRIYINGFKKLPVNKARYGIMLREDGIPFDDGTVGRLSDHEFVITTTTAHAAMVMLHMEHLAQVVWPGLRVHLSSVTDQWATIALAGPKSRDVLSKVLEGADVSNNALPFMGILQTSVDNIDIRVFRISFSGELAYEINVPSRFAHSLWEILLQRGEEYGVQPYGTEAMAVLRIEKGHVVGVELDGRNTLHDLNFQRMASTKKDYIGRYYRDREAFINSQRPQLVGLIPVEEQKALRGGAQITSDQSYTTPCNAIGHVTSTTFSPALGHYIALGMVENGRQREGEIVYSQYPLKKETIAARIVNPVFFDPAGERLHG